MCFKDILAFSFTKNYFVSIKASQFLSWVERAQKLQRSSGWSNTWCDFTHGRFESFLCECFRCLRLCAICMRNNALVAREVASCVALKGISISHLNASWSKLVALVWVNQFKFIFVVVAVVFFRLFIFM